MKPHRPAPVGRKLLACATFVATALAHLHGQSAPAVQLEPYVVTATRTPTPRDETAASVTVVTATDLTQAGYTDPADVLRMVPGLYLTSPGPEAGAGRLLTRGTPTRQTVITLDGRRLPPALAGAFDLSNLTLDNIDHIEILRGPSSALDGGNAIGGVINLISHRATPGVPEGQVTAEAGSFDTVRTAVTGSAATTKADVSAAASWLSTDNARANNDLDRKAANVTVGWQVTGPARLDLALSYFRSDAGFPDTTSVNNPLARLQSEVFSVSPGLRVNSGDRFQESLFYSLSRQQLSPSGFSASTYPAPQPADESVGANGTTTVTSNQLDYQATYRATDTWLLTAGATWLRTEAKRFNNGTGDVPFGFTAPGDDILRTDTSAGIFLQSQWEPRPDVHLIQALRHDTTSSYGDSTTWRLAGSWRLPESRTLLQASYATAFAPPSVQDTSPALYGNPDLQPERSRGWELGLEQPLANHLLVANATYFYNRVTDLIQYDSSAFTVTNIGRNTNSGVELGLKFTPWSKLSWQADYTFLEARDDLAATPLIGRPKHLVQSTLTWTPTDAWSVVLGGRWVGGVQDYSPGAFTATPQPSYGTYRAMVRWQPSARLTLFARVENLLNSAYAEIPGYPANPRGLYAGASLKF